MDINIGDYLTFRNIILAIFCLPLMTMLITMPFLTLISKSTKEWLELLGFFGGLANCIFVIELGFRTVAEIIYYATQKPKLFSEFTDGKLSMVKHYEPFDFFSLKYLIVFLIITIATWVVADIYSTKRKFGRLRKKYSEKNPLNLSE